MQVTESNSRLQVQSLPCYHYTNLRYIFTFHQQTGKDAEGMV